VKYRSSKKKEKKSSIKTETYSGQTEKRGAPLGGRRRKGPGSSSEVSSKPFTRKSGKTITGKKDGHPLPKVKGEKKCSKRRKVPAGGGKVTAPSSQIMGIGKKRNRPGYLQLGKEESPKEGRRRDREKRESSSDFRIARGAGWEKEKGAKEKRTRL